MFDEGKERLLPRWADWVIRRLGAAYVGTGLVADDVLPELARAEVAEAQAWRARARERILLLRQRVDELAQVLEAGADAPALVRCEARVAQQLGHVSEAIAAATRSGSVD